MPISKKSITSIIILCTLLFSVFQVNSCSESKPNGSNTGDNVNSWKRPEISYADLRYSRPDFNCIYKKIDIVTELTDSQGNYETIQNELSEINTLCGSVVSACSLIKLKQYQNVNDKLTETEAEYISENLFETQKRTYEMIVRLWDSDYRSLLKNISEKEIKNLLKKISYMDSDYKHLVCLEQKVISDYRKLRTNTKISLNNKEYDSHELYTLFADKKISYDEYISAFTAYLKKINESTASLFISLTDIRKSLALKNQYNDYTSYAYKELYGRIYSPSEVSALYAEIKKHIVPLAAEIAESFTDAEINYLNNFLYSSGKYQNDILSFTEIIGKEMSESYKYMLEFNLYDVGAREGKYPFPITFYLHGNDIPFLYFTPTGDANTIFSFISNLSQFYSYYQNGKNSAISPEIHELIAQSAEWLFCEKINISDYTKEIYTKYKTLTTLNMIIRASLSDEFEQKIYSGEFKSREEINRLFSDLSREYRLSDSLDVPTEYYWSYINNLFENPLYNISYAAAAIPSLDMHSLAISDWALAVKTYQSIVNTTRDKSYMDVIQELRLPYFTKKNEIIYFVQRIKRTLKI